MKKNSMLVWSYHAIKKYRSYKHDFNINISMKIPEDRSSRHFFFGKKRIDISKSISLMNFLLGMLSIFRFE